jgi:hypothetical protein
MAKWDEPELTVSTPYPHPPDDIPAIGQEMPGRARNEHRHAYTSGSNFIDTMSRTSAPRPFQNLEIIFMEDGICTESMRRLPDRLHTASSIHKNGC